MHGDVHMWTADMGGLAMVVVVVEGGTGGLTDMVDTVLVWGNKNDRGNGEGAGGAAWW